MKLKNTLPSIRLHRRRMAMPLLVCVLTMLAVSACTDGTDDTGDDSRLPEGAYPMTFTASVDGLTATRATADNTWAGGERVTIQAGDKVSIYSASSSGRLAASNLFSTPLYWKSATETKTVTAWYYGKGYTTTTPPSDTQWMVLSDQSATEPGNTADNYQRSDLLYAPATDISFSERNTASLTFYHQTARVVVNILKAEAATDASAIQSVVIGHADNLVLMGRYTAPTRAGATVGTWDTSSGSPTMGTITPRKLTTPGTLAGGGTALASYAALVIPQQMKNKRFIVVSLANGNTYYYTPKETEEANLQSGRQHTYNITVKHGYLEVTSVTVGSAWGNNGSEEEVTTDKTPSNGYAPGDLKLGDYYYNDGTTSDGGYRKYSDGTTATMPVQPVLTGADGKERTVIGLVFKAGRDGSDKGSYININGEEMSTINGYVVALRDVLDRGLVWANKNGEYRFRVGTSTSKDWQGYDNCQKMKNGSGWSIENLPAAKACITFGTAKPYLQYAAPAGSSGWFLPSFGQLLSLYNDRKVLSGQIDKLKAMNGYESIGWFVEYRRYWSSSEFNLNDGSAQYVDFSNGNWDAFNKNSNYYVRGVFAF